MNRLQKAALAVRELGLEKVALFGLYRLGYLTGHWRRCTPPAPWPSVDPRAVDPQPIFRVPTQAEVSALLSPTDQQTLLDEASLILSGQMRFFSAEPRPLDLCPSGVEQHWTQIRDDDPYADIKFIWEPARFTWAFTLARAYQITADADYPQAFWRCFHQFIQANPLNMGPNWASGQEVALRLIALVFAWQIFARPETSTPADRAALLSAVAAHAQRIPPTLLYARAQNNNHLVSEAAGLYIAGVFLKGHPAAPRWQRLGWRWLNRAWQTQISPDGTYIQHSANYHRLMLQVCLAAISAAQTAGDALPAESLTRLQSAADWAASLMEPSNGALPNLGHNDGSLFLPLASAPYADYRPTLQAASIAFSRRRALPPGPWDELAAWLLLPAAKAAPAADLPAHPCRLNSANSWAVLRAARFTDRPAHADQLHVDLWYRGQNIACDAGTYRYTAPPPWDHPLARTLAHNTLTLHNRDQMLRAGRFLWLGWAQAAVQSPSDPASLTAAHNGYAALGIQHSRSLALQQTDNWLVTDRVTALRPSSAPCPACLHWLLPDLPWSFEAGQLIMRLPTAVLRLNIQAFSDQDQPLELSFQVIRAGQLLLGSGECPPFLGWVSPTYDARQPAISLRACLAAPLNYTLISRWIFTQP